MELKEKLDALTLMKLNTNLPNFQVSMRQLFTTHDFMKINEKLIQIELLNSVACTKHYSLIDPLRKMQKTFSKTIDPEVEEAIEEAIL